VDFGQVITELVPSSLCWWWSAAYSARLDGRNADRSICYLAGTIRKLCFVPPAYRYSHKATCQ